MSNPHAVGIDLGTTYSVVAMLDETGRTQIIRNTEGELLTPSVVLYEDSEVIVGKEAKKATAVKAGAVAEFVKRDMGKKYYSRTIHGEKLHPEVIQACILKKLKDDAIATVGQNFEVVITVPAYFDEPRRKATADSGEMAGLKVLDIVNEPTAAALAFGESLGYLTAEGNTREPLKILVYDLGGGTFDVTLLDLKPGDFRTLVTDGDVQLGGHDWDMRLANYAAEQFQKQYNLDPRQSPASLAALLANIEEAKHTLTARPKTTLTVRHGGHVAELPIGRELFEELTEDLLERTAYTSRQVLAAANLTWKQIDRVLLVGGSTRMPMVSRMIEQLTGLTPDRNVNPDEAVARGAAIFAGYLLHQRHAGSTPHFKVTDVNSHSLGIEGIDQRTMRKENVPIIPRNTPLPAKVTKKCVTKAEDQLSIVVKVLEGESRNPKQCSIIGKAVMRNLPEHLPKGWPVEVTYEYLTNGRLDVQARLPGTSKKVDLELQREEGLTAERIGNWKLVLAQAKGFDAFEGMLDEVMHASRADRHAAVKGPVSLTAATKRIPDIDETRDLTAAEKAFAGIDAQLAPTVEGRGQSATAKVANKPAAVRPVVNPNPMRISTEPAKSLAAAKPLMSAPGAAKPSANPPADLKSAAVAAATSFDEREAVKQKRRRPARRPPPAVMALINVAALLMVSAVAILLFYYLIAWSTKMGDFLHLNLPGLRAPKVKQTSWIDSVPRAMSYVHAIFDH